MLERHQLFPCHFYKRTFLEKRQQAPINNDILRFYVVQKDYENLLVSDTLEMLYNYTNEMMTVEMDFNGRHLTMENFCKRPSSQPVGSCPIP